ncbi:pimeloyl-ACP methyl ester carboxylesterase [Endobacter medicaginis]|uniref:Pimeloyl-ACP methyl ester carboxylesterase n=1 Tax=Endobacter medicaginis TaxID=1181271 RepID=A0A839UTC7_9PROT|nr:alpha/beta fold hydrolase [Endobacter medicaginis]MBB3173036.1 pimeloyl-ACP methyl ester carboxylesterase [Endobacter medicaginis]MCX5474539.1 alpha/beta fold hydrolase [Endobacter medicaginis]
MPIDMLAKGLRASLPPSLPVVLIPGLLASPRLYAPVMPALWRSGAVSVADTVHADTIAGMAARLLADAPERFALAGLSMGGYVAMEVMRQAPGRVDRLALLDTSARPDTAEAAAGRERQIEVAESGRFGDLIARAFPQLVHSDRHGDTELQALMAAMAEDVGARAFVAQQRAIMKRIDSRPSLSTIACPTLVLVGAEDQLTPPVVAREMADAIAGAKLVEIQRCGHISTLEQPEAVSRALTAWLSA